MRQEAARAVVCQEAAQAAVRQAATDLRRLRAALKVTQEDVLQRAAGGISDAAGLRRT
jgi:hypothetical protein